MNKGKERGALTIIAKNEQREKKHHQLLVKMNKGQRRRVKKAIENEQKKE